MKLFPVPRIERLSPERVPAAEVVETIDERLPTQGYELGIDARSVRLVGGDEAGLYYGRLTLDQLRRPDPATLPLGFVADHPDLMVRGVMLDVSRDKVPTMDTLRAIVIRLASWKVNQLQLYTEHTFAYTAHPEVHADASPLTSAEIHELDALCRAHHMELVPNQNCLGHMNRWLGHERYRGLAIAPDGFVDPFGMRRPPMTIEPTHPEAQPFIRSLLAELLPNFSSRRVHVGLDEAWELPRSRSADYLAWMRMLRALPELDGYEMLVWGDMVSGDRELLGQIPAGVTVCEWGYDDSYPFQERCETLSAAALPFWVAPGTSSWLSIGGRATNASRTCANAMDAALDHGATGFLNTDWGDQGHLQQLPISDPGLIYGAAVSWCSATNKALDIGAALSTWAYDDDSGGMAEAVLVLGDIHRALTPQFPNMSTLTLHLYLPQLSVGRGLTRGIQPEELDEVDQRLEQARQALLRNRSRRVDAATLVAEIKWTIDLLALLTADARARLAGDGNLESVPTATRQDLATRLAPLVDTHRELWMGRNRAGGLRDSAAWLENLAGAYRSGRPDPHWGGLGG